LSVIRHPSQRVAVFADVSNLYHSAKHLHDARVNFGVLLKEAVAGRALIRSIAYAITTGDAEEQPFFDALTKAEFETRVKDLQVFAGGAKKGDWDIGLAMDAIRIAPSVDAIVLATGDGDYVPLVQYLQSHFGMQVEVAAFGGSASAKLIEVADAFTDLSDNKFLIRIGRTRRSGAKGTTPSSRTQHNRSASAKS